MGFSSDRAIQTPNFVQYEELMDQDLSFYGGGLYETLSSLLAQFILRDKDELTIKDAILSGLKVIPDTGMNIILKNGSAVSFAGSYVLNEITGIMDFITGIGQPFLAAVSSDISLVVPTAHATYDRHDIVQMRPYLITYDPHSRNFKDPISGNVTSSSINTKREIKCEAQIKKGVEDGSNIAPNTDSGWIKIAEISVPALTSTITESLIKNVTAMGTGAQNIEWTSETTRTYLFTIDPAIVGETSFYSGTGIADPATRTEDIGDRTGDTVSKPGWKVANGLAGTPPMLERFLRMEAASGNTGGSDDAVVVSHYHSINHDHGSFTSGGSGTLYTNYTNPSHRHYFYICYSDSGSWPDTDKSTSATTCYTIYTSTTSINHRHSINSHTHSINPPNYTGNSGTTGGSGTGMNKPAYYSLIPIIKMS